jgi:hypothetical protein
MSEKTLSDVWAAFQGTLAAARDYIVDRGTFTENALAIPNDSLSKRFKDQFNKLLSGVGNNLTPLVLPVLLAAGAYLLFLYLQRRAQK